MRTVLLLLTTIFCSAASAQNILDSIELYEYPVRQGVIYKYENKNNPAHACASSLSIVSVVTHNDSVFHFENGKVAGVFTIDNMYTIIIKNAKEEFITYSNLQAVALKKGDNVNRGMYLGITAESDVQEGLNQVDILVLQKVKRMPYRKTIDYIRRNMSEGKPAYYTL